MNYVLAWAVFAGLVLWKGDAVPSTQPELGELSDMSASDFELLWLEALRRRPRSIQTLAEAVLRLAELPQDVDWREVWATAWLGGIGFTMSLFIANLAFPDAALLASSKLAILAASVLSALGGWWILSRVAGTRRHPAP